MKTTATARMTVIGAPVFAGEGVTSGRTGRVTTGRLIAPLSGDDSALSALSTGIGAPGTKPPDGGGGMRPPGPPFGPLANGRG